MKHFTDAVDAWGNTMRSRYREEILACRHTIEEARAVHNACDNQVLVETKRRLSIHLAHEDAFWGQRAKVYWLCDRDTNSKFFHALASARRRRNHISKLVTEDGIEVTEQQGMCEIIGGYFTELFRNC